MTVPADSPSPRQQLETFEPQKAALGMVFLLANQLETVGNHFLGELTSKQWFLLANLDSFFQSPPTISQVAQTMHISHQTVKQLALKLQAKGFVQLQKDAQDQRAWRIHLTQKAYAYSSARLGKDLAFLEALLNGVSPVSLDSFLATALQIHDNLTRMEGQDLTE